MSQYDHRFSGAGNWPEIDTKGMIEVDLLMVHSLRISLVQMMENAGRALAALARDRYLGGDARGRHVAVLAGAGGNGGGALTAARRLAAWGARVSVVLAQEPGAMTAAPAAQLSILAQMGVHPGAVPEAPVDLILDGLVGYSLRGAPHGAVAGLIGWANAQPAPTLALDVPSGFDARQGLALAPMIAADATLTLALPKRGLAAPELRPCVGTLFLADISVPPALYLRLSRPLVVPPFAQGDIVQLTA
jgi:NAD(P)H-hydrate epimerase